MEKVSEDCSDRPGHSCADNTTDPILPIWRLIASLLCNENLVSSKRYKIQGNVEKQTSLV